MVISHTVESPALHYSALRVRNFELEGGQIISWHVRVPYNAAIFKVKFWVDIPHALRLFILSPHVVSKDNKIVMLGFLADVFFLLASFSFVWATVFSVRFQAVNY